MIAKTPTDETLAIGSRMMAYASEQLLQAQTHLARKGEARHSGLHEARKCIRRTRATLALGACAFDERAKRLDDDLGRLCRGLSPLRDAQALIEALRRLENSAPPAASAILPRAEMAARKRRDEMLERAMKRDPQFKSRRKRLLALQARLLCLQWQAVSDKDVSNAVTRSKRRAEKARQRIKRHPDDDAWHAFRRRLRRLRQQDSLLEELQPDLRPGIKNLEHQARTLGESQDDVLLLSHCGSRSPFTPDQRKRLKDVARERLRGTRTH
jgi:CHAD domain-containing protein